MGRDEEQPNLGIIYKVLRSRSAEVIVVDGVIRRYKLRDLGLFPGDLLLKSLPLSSCDSKALLDQAGDNDDNTIDLITGLEPRTAKYQETCRHWAAFNVLHAQIDKALAEKKVDSKPLRDCLVMLFYRLHRSADQKPVINQVKDFLTKENQLPNKKMMAVYLNAVDFIARRYRTLSAKTVGPALETWFTRGFYDCLSCLTDGNPHWSPKSESLPEKKDPPHLRKFHFYWQLLRDLFKTTTMSISTELVCPFEGRGFVVQAPSNTKLFQLNSRVKLHPIVTTGEYAGNPAWIYCAYKNGIFSACIYGKQVFRSLSGKSLFELARKQDLIKSCVFQGVGDCVGYFVLMLAVKYDHTFSQANFFPEQTAQATSSPEPIVGPVSSVKRGLAAARRAKKGGLKFKREGVISFLSDQDVINYACVSIHERDAILSCITR